MNTGYYDTEDSIAALATPWGESALAVIRTSGRDAVALFAACFSRPERIRKAGNATIVHGYITDPGSGEAVDEVTAAVFLAPAGYTGQDSVEIYCHGSLPGINRILEVLHSGGFRDARPGEFTLRAFMNGKLDLTRAEAVSEIISSKSRKAQSLALGRLSGNLFNEIDAVKQELAGIMSIIELQLDYAEDEIEEPVEIPVDILTECRNRLVRLASTYSTGRLYAEGARIVLTGRTNSGKSSLFNLFLKEDRSIVSDIHGTTRDYIESWISVRGIPVKLFDTAGFRVSGDSVEEEGIKRSTRIAESADLILYLIDGSEGMTVEAVRDLAEMGSGSTVIPVWNKADISKDSVPEGAVAVSALTGYGFDLLEERIVSSLPGNAISSDSEIMIDSLRQKELLDHAVQYIDYALEGVRDGVPLDITAPEIGGALGSLGEITGEITSADILDRIFSGFCVGK